MQINFKISEAQTSHISQLSTLWKTSFGDSDEYINFFMEHKFHQCKTLIAEVDNRVVASLYLMPLSTIEYGVIKEGYYLYALSVESKHRGLGIGKELVKESCRLADFQNKFIILCPASESLRCYYESMGFVENSYLCEKTFQHSDTSTSLFCCELNTNDFQKLRNDYFKNLIFWDFEELKFILEENKFNSGFNLKFTIDNGDFFIIGKTTNYGVVITESNASENVRIQIHNYLSKELNIQTTKWIIPFENGINCTLVGMTYNLAKDNYYFNHILN